MVCSRCRPALIKEFLIKTPCHWFGQLLNRLSPYFLPLEIFFPEIHRLAELDLTRWFSRWPWNVLSKDCKASFDGQNIKAWRLIQFLLLVPRIKVCQVVVQYVRLRMLWLYPSVVLVLEELGLNFQVSSNSLSLRSFLNHETNIAFACLLALKVLELKSQTHNWWSFWSGRHKMCQKPNTVKIR